MTIKVIPYTTAQAVVWDEFCTGAVNATFLHTRRFLSYHGDRFKDKSLLIVESEKLVGVFPTAESKPDPKLVISHPGITYGGIVHLGWLRGERMIDTMVEVCRYYATQGYEKLVYKAIPTFYHHAPSQDDVYALFRLGATQTRCDLSSTIDLQHRLPVSERRRRSLKKAIKAQVKIVEGVQYLPDFWKVLAKNLADKHSSSPVHTVHEITSLAALFPENIHCICGLIDGKVEAGTLLFITPTTYHAQYIASSLIGYSNSVLDAIFEYGIYSAQQHGKRWFDFGISTENNGLALNNGLYQFKSEFGAGGVVYNFFEVNLMGL